jgi:prolipoprotein diacylglyceryltransferase
MDAVAPVLMIAYAVGRIGCHVSGDGDWGIFNTAYTLDSEGAIVRSAEGDFEKSIASNPEFGRYLTSQYGGVEKIPRAHVPGLPFLPDWFWAYNYPHNVNEVGSPIPGCEGAYCNQLNPLVFPTPLYEIIACALLFIPLWMLRKKIKVPGRLFALYLVFNGAERFLVEKIRVNSTYDIFGFHPTQAELISTLLMLGAAFLWWWTGRRIARS